MHVLYENPLCLLFNAYNNLKYSYLVLKYTNKCEITQRVDKRR